MKDLVIIENDWTASLAQAGFLLHKGWNDQLAAKLVDASKEQAMLENVPRDAKERFPDSQAAHRWQSGSKRAIYSLFQDDNLAGIVWFTYHPRPDLDADYTYAIRMYELSRGKGLAYDFTRAAQTDFTVSDGYKGAIWLETNSDNAPARKLYEKFGYKLVSENEGRLTFVYKSSE